MNKATQGEIESTNGAGLAPMEQLLAFVDWERKQRPDKLHTAEWARNEIYRLHTEIERLQAAAPAPFLRLSPVCGSQCSDCNGSISQADQLKYAMRYAFLRNQRLDSLNKGGVFAGKTPENLVLNEDDLDEAIDAAIAKAEGKTA